MNRRAFSGGKKNLWILEIVLILAVAVTPIPVKASGGLVKIKVREQPYIPGVSMGGWVWVIVDIEIPYEWDLTEDGIIGWSFDVHVDPDVLTPWSVHGASFGYFFYDFVDWNMLDPVHYPALLVGEVNKTEGFILMIAEAVMGFGALGMGAGGNSSDPTWYGAGNGLCKLRFRSESQTAYSLINITNAAYYTYDPLAPGEYEKHLIADEDITDGHYNVQELPATISLDPNTLNMKSKGKWTTAYMQFPQEYKTEDIDATTILLNGTIELILDPKYDFVTNSSEYIVDHNGDGVMERMVKFNRTEVASWIHDDLDIDYGNVALTITGELYDGTPFEGSDVVRVRFPGDVDNDGDVDPTDFSIFAGCYGLSVEDLGYDSRADFNEDGDINPEDLSTLSANYGKTAN